MAAGSDVGRKGPKQSKTEQRLRPKKKKKTPRRVARRAKKDAHKMRHEKKQKEALPAHNAATLPV